MEIVSEIMIIYTIQLTDRDNFFYCKDKYWHRLNDRFSCISPGKLSSHHLNDAFHRENNQPAAIDSESKIQCKHLKNYDNIWN